MNVVSQVRYNAGVIWYQSNTLSSCQGMFASSYGYDCVFFG
ncbi:uncharacterized protein METZ01_LOCUS439016 [marine metagenome]|uniref:Uncharacterized protein n=1 Tax=marine metagenome TaxID=408172 RepID=A0A382YSB3_9ZZZZ